MTMTRRRDCQRWTRRDRPTPSPVTTSTTVSDGAGVVGCHRCWGGVDNDNDNDAATAQRQCLGVRTTKTTDTYCCLHLWRLAPPAAEAMTTIINAGWETLQPPPAQVLLLSLSGLDKDGRTHLAPDKKNSFPGIIFFLTIPSTVPMG